jgi:hypothetical protein
MSAAAAACAPPALALQPTAIYPDTFSREFIFVEERNNAASEGIDEVHVTWGMNYDESVEAAAVDGGEGDGIWGPDRVRWIFWQLVEFLVFCLAVFVYFLTLISQNACASC